MKHLLKKVSALNSKVIAHIKMGNDTFNILSRDNSFYGIYDGCEVLYGSAKKANNDKIASIVKDFIECHTKCNKNQGFVVFRDKHASDFENFSDQIKDIPGVKKCVVKAFPEDMSEINKSLHPEFSVEQALNNSSLITGMQDLSKTVSDLNNTLNVCRGDALNLTQGKLVNTMWGAKSMQHTIDDLHEEIFGNNAWDRVEFFSSLVMKSIDRLIHKLAIGLQNVNQEEKKVICTVLIPNILSNYEQIKLVASSALVSLSVLMSIDAMFKKLTSYPATWFMNGNMLEDMRLDYQKLLSFMMQVPKIEQDVIYPLDFIKVQG
jgi:hypothetical protein